MSRSATKGVPWDKAPAPCCCATVPPTRPAMTAAPAPSSAHRALVVVCNLPLALQFSCAPPLWPHLLVSRGCLLCACLSDINFLLYSEFPHTRATPIMAHSIHLLCHVLFFISGCAVLNKSHCNLIYSFIHSFIHTHTHTLTHTHSHTYTHTHTL